MLIKTAKNGTAKKLSSLPYQIAAKTGTVGGYNGMNSDAWCVSFTPEYTSCVWFGGKDYSEDNNIDVTGGGIPTLLTANVFGKLDINKRDFDLPKSIIPIKIDAYAQNKDKKIYIANKNTPKKYQKEYYSKRKERN